MVHNRFFFRLQNVSIIFGIIISLFSLSLADATGQQTNDRTNSDIEQTIRIGFLTEDDPGKDQQSLQALQAAMLAVEQINASGGVSGKPVELVIRSGDGAWGSGSIKSIELIYDEDVVAILGSLDGRNAHLAEMAIAKAHVVYLETRATDQTLSEANLPWFFRLLPSDFQQAKNLATVIYDRKKLNQILLLHSDSYDDEMAAHSFLRYSRIHNLPMPVTQKFHRTLTDVEEIIHSLRNQKFDGVLIMSDPEFLSHVIIEMNQAGIDLPLFTNLSLLNDVTVLSEIQMTQNISSVCPDGWHSTNHMTFSDLFFKKFGYQPGIIGAYAFDGLKVLANALSQLSKADGELTTHMANTDYQDGVTGHIQFLENGDIFDLTRICRLKNE